MFRISLMSFLISASSFFLPAQIQNPGNYDNGTNFNILYKSDASGKLYVNTRGYGISFRRAKHVTSNSSNFYEVDVRALKHPKEVKLTGDGPEKKRYVYGKLNNVLLAGGNIGTQKVLFTKADSKAVEVRYSYSLGPFFALAKPYYVRVYKSSSNKKDPTLIRFDQDGFTSDSGRVVGRAPFSKGLPDMKIYPGVNAKFNLSFEYAPYSNLIRAIETGVSIDYFPNALPIMFRNPSENIVVTINLGFVFGRKWY